MRQRRPTETKKIMDQNIKSPVVTEEDVLKGFKEVEVLARDGTIKKIVVKAMNWRTALGVTFKTLDQAMIHLVENCIAKEAQPILDSIVPVHLIWLTNVAQQLTHGIDALKKANAAAAATAKAAVPPATPISAPSSAN